MRTLATRALALALCAIVVSTARAQVANGGGAGRPGATRAELDSLMLLAEVQASSSSSADVRAEKQLQAATIRQRLRDGDFDVGDIIVVSVPSDSALSDTFAVQAGRTLQLPNLPEVTLVGVLRSELRAHLAQTITQFVRDTALTATAFLRIGVLGEVAHPGYYGVPLDAPIADVLMAAGGPTPRTDIARTVVRRGSQQVLSKHDVRDAMVQGLTLDQLSLGPGDEFVVRAKREWGSVFQLVALASGILLAVRAF